MMERHHMPVADEVLSVRVTGQLTRDTYEALASLVKQHVRHHGKIRVLMELNAFYGFADEGDWEDVDFDPRQWLGVERLALVGEPKWALAMAVLCRSLTSATIRHFDCESLDAAVTWVAAT
jgi:hypothetical protein